MSTDQESTQNYLEKLWAGAPKDVLNIQGSMKFGDEMKYITVKFDPKKYPKGIDIIHLTDVQYGHMSCNVEKFQNYLNWILEEENRFIFFGGDMVDAATVLSVASPYENTKEPQGQVYDFVKLVMPIRHRVIGYVGGNHERRSSKAFGDLGHLIATLLKIPYSSGKQFVDIYYGNHQPHKNSLWHGGTGSKTKGSKAQMIHRFMTKGDSQVYWVGHLHDVMMIGDCREARGEGGTIKLEKFAGVMSSSFLEHYGTYAEVAGLPAGDTAMWLLHLDSNGKWQLQIR